MRAGSVNLSTLIAFADLHISARTEAAAFPPTDHRGPRRLLVAQARRPSRAVTPFKKRRRISIPPSRVSGFPFPVCDHTNSICFGQQSAKGQTSAFVRTAVSEESVNKLL